MKPKNPAGKRRDHTNPYASWKDVVTGWEYRVLKSYQVNNNAEYSRWLIWCKGYAGMVDIGDAYVRGVIRISLYQAIGINATYDKSVWSSEDEFLAWARGK